MPGSLRLTTFGDVNLADPFFDSLKAQYNEFSDWFARKAAEPVYVVDDDMTGQLRGFIYLKIEEDVIEDIEPALPALKRVKVGTLKILAHGTKLGERVIKKIFDHAVASEAEEIYVTVFEEHAGLIRLFERYGFILHGYKTTDNGREAVFVRSLVDHARDGLDLYPLIRRNPSRIYLLAIYPDYHTNLFPDSILRTEVGHIVEDVSHTNTIHKVYIAKMVLTRLRRGDIVVIYRTTDIPGRARFRSVATSICVVEESHSRADFANEQDFVDFALPHSVFPEAELRDWYRDRAKRLYAVKMTYNAALPRRPNREVLLDDVGISESPRWDFRKISEHEFDRIVELSELDPRLIVE
ncbi:GNAT family N-acetyltransferase [Methylobacterium sp. Leaf465]|uniref:GNAT family N-acetyltransferase n=1 Tax=Methylobacterium sp. Leaf465 TaxID=1736385 RepID=UPI0009E701ED|nr:GNAT family N-acetyltransferase [Methylobacterium sp. Leaf465]